MKISFDIDECGSAAFRVHYYGTVFSIFTLVVIALLVLIAQ